MTVQRTVAEVFEARLTPQSCCKDFREGRQCNCLLGIINCLPDPTPGEKDAPPEDKGVLIDPLRPETLVHGFLHSLVGPLPPGMRDTPGRVVRALREMTSGYRDDEAEILKTTFDVEYDEVILLTGIPFVSLCEHHLLPFTGTADVGYLPSTKVAGLSKLARLVDCFAKRFQMQERLTRQVADALMQHLGAKGVGVVIRAKHSCLACRGVKKPGAEMVTSVMLGAFRDKPEARAEFLSLCRGGG